MVRDFFSNSLLCSYLVIVIVKLTMFILTIQIFCLQHFPLGNFVARGEAQAITYWNDERVKRRVAIEKESKTGLLHVFKRGGMQAHATFDPETMLTHPVVLGT